MKGVVPVETRPQCHLMHQRRCLCLRLFSMATEATYLLYVPFMYSLRAAANPIGIYLRITSPVLDWSNLV